jgi:type IV pilus assembly protein PilM
MIDFKKEIYLSDLVRRTAKTNKRNEAAVKTKKAGKLRRKSVGGELIGLKVGATQLAAARVSNANGHPKVLQLARQPLPHGIVTDGEVRDVAALAAGLNEFFSVNKLPRKNVRIGIATNHVGVRIFELAGIDDERQLANAVLFRAHEAVSIPVEEAVIDYRVIHQETDDTGTVNRRILLVAAYREPIERYVEAFRQAGIGVVGVDLEAFALLRAVRSPLGDDEEAAAATVAVNVGHERTSLAVSDGRICQFTRVLEWGGSRLVEAVGRELGVAVEQAEQIVVNLSLDPDTIDEGDDQRLPRAREAALRELQTLARELVASLQFYQGQPESLPIAEILLSGGTSRILGFAAELERLTRVHVRPADVLARVEAENGIAEREDLASLAIAIGLGVDD